MIFIDTPPSDRVPNYNIENAALPTGIKFVDEIIALKVLSLSHHVIIITDTFHLFLNHKPDQPDQYCTIIDGKDKVEMRYAQQIPAIGLARIALSHTFIQDFLMRH